MTTLKLLVDSKNALGECVLWCERSQRVFWTDIPAAILWCYRPSSAETCSWPMPERLASFALTQDDDCLLLGLASRLAYFNLSTGMVSPICPVEADLPTTRINDGRCDRQGRFVFGTLNEAADHAACASFYRLNIDLTLERLPLPNVAIANSICFSPDGSTMYYCDSLDKTIRCCDYDPVTGAVQGSRIFVDLTQEPGVPDGSIIDAQGYLWNAQWGGRRVLRFAPDGSVDRVLAVPVEQPSCVALGGAHWNELLVSSARVSMSGPALVDEPHAGGLLHAIVSDVQGLPEVRFAGK